MSATSGTEATAEETSAAGPAGAAGELTDKQARILAYLRERAGERTYFKSRLVAEALDLTAKEVGANMPAVVEAARDVDIEKWGYSSGTTWMVTPA